MGLKRKRKPKEPAHKHQNPSESWTWRLRAQTRSPKHTLDVKNLQKKFFGVSEEGKTWGGKDGDRGDGEKHPLETNEENKAVKTVRYLRIYERKNETISPNPLQDSQDQERKKETKYDFKEIKSCAKRRKKNSSAKKKGQIQVQSPVKLMRELFSNKSPVKKSQKFCKKATN